MGKCLITKLNGIVNNDELNILDAAYIGMIPKGTTLTGYLTQLNASIPNSCVLKITKGATGSFHNTSTNSSVDLATGFVLPTDGKFTAPCPITVSAPADRNAYLYITDRYHLKYLDYNFMTNAKTFGIGDLPELIKYNNGGNNKGSIFAPFHFSKCEEFSVTNSDLETTLSGDLSNSSSPTLKMFSVGEYARYDKSTLHINIDTLDFPKLETIAIKNCDVVGDISSLSSIVLTNISFEGKGNGMDIDKFAKSQIAKGRNSGTCKITLDRTVKTITFNSAVENGYEIS